jgi:hypothetical protein
MRLRRQGGIDGIVVDAQITLALVRQAQGRSTEAVALLEQATELVDEWNDAATSIRVRAFGARLAASCGETGTAEKWARLYGDRVRADANAQFVIEQLVLARISIFTAQAR